MSIPTKKQLDAMAFAQRENLVRFLRQHGLTWHRDVILFRYYEEFGLDLDLMLEATGEQEVLDSIYSHDIRDSGDYEH